MQKRLDAQVLASIEGYRKRERALAKIEELSRKDAWTVAIKIRLMASRQAKLCHRLCYKRYGFDVQSWLAKDPMDFSSLTRSCGSGEATTILENVFAYAWRGTATTS